MLLWPGVVLVQKEVGRSRIEVGRLLKIPAQNTWLKIVAGSRPEVGGSRPEVGGLNPPNPSGKFDSVVAGVGVLDLSE